MSHGKVCLHSLHLLYLLCHCAINHKANAYRPSTNICWTWTKAQIHSFSPWLPLPTLGPFPTTKGLWGMSVDTHYSNSLFWKLLAIWARNSAVPSTQCPECSLKLGAEFRVYPWPRHLTLNVEGQRVSVLLGTRHRAVFVCCVGSQEYLSSFPEEFWLNILSSFRQNDHM